jgi:transposase-like protein
MNPHWIRIIQQTTQAAARKCPHCGKTRVYPPKQSGQYHVCKVCHRKFQEKGGASQDAA